MATENTFFLLLVGCKLVIGWAYIGFLVCCYIYFGQCMDFTVRVYKESHFVLACSVLWQDWLKMREKRSLDCHVELTTHLMTPALIILRALISLRCLFSESIRFEKRKSICVHISSRLPSSFDFREHTTQ